MVVHPQLCGHGVFAGVLVVAVRGADEPPVVGLNLADGGRQVADAAMKIVGGGEERDRAGHAAEVCVVADRGVVDGAELAAVADAAAGGGRREDPRVGGGHDGQLAAHGMAIDAEAGGVDFRLLFEERQRPPAGDGREEPAGVPRGIDRVQCPRGRLGADKRVAGVAAGGVVAVDGGPVGGEAVPWVVRAALPEELHDLRVDAVVRRADPPGPREGERGVAAGGVGDAGPVVGVLPAAVDLQQTGDAARPVAGDAVHAGHAGDLSLEDADAQPHDLQVRAALGPLVQGLDFEWFGPGVEVAPKVFDGRRRVAAVQRRERVGGEDEQGVREHAGTLTRRPGGRERRSSPHAPRADRRRRNDLRRAGDRRTFRAGEAGPRR